MEFDESMKIKDIWKEYLAELDTRFRGYSDRLKPPASLEQIKETEEKMDLSLPEELKELYCCNNGDTDKVLGTILGLPFLSLEEMYSKWKVWKEIIEEEDEKGMEELSMFCKSHPEGAIQEIYANVKWIPFCYDYGGNHIGIDLDPGPSGTAGQIINFGRDEDKKSVIAPNLSVFLQMMLHWLKTERFEVILDNEGYDQALIIWEGDEHPIDRIVELVS